MKVKNVVRAIVCLMVMGNVVYADISIEQRDALIALYTDTNGNEWNSNDGWKKSELEFDDEGTECDWDGVTCDSATRSKVIEIDLGRNNLSGSIPDSLNDLEYLTELDLHSNGLGGEIPSTLGNLLSLKVLDLSDNNLDGSIPSELGDLVSLKELYLNENDLRNGIHFALGDLSNLEILDLSDNESLGSSIPIQLGNLSNLTELYLNNAGLKGAIPEELFALTALTHLDLGSNQMLEFGYGDSGYTFETETGANSNLVYLNLSSTLEGPITSRLELIPEELGNILSLQELYISGNSILSGDIPDSLGNLSNLTTLYISFNGKLVSGIPTAFGGLTNLTTLNLSANSLTGNIPTELGSLSKLVTLDLGSNTLLDGSIPPELGNLSNLEQLDLGSNLLGSNKGDTTIPPELWNLTKLIKLDLGSNQLDGTISSEIKNLLDLEDLDLSSNLLSGQIPSDIGALPNLDELDLHSNKLMGAIPSGLADLSQINIDYNACYAEDEAVKKFIIDKDPDWEKKQTVAPETLAVVGVTQDSISISWTPILYDGDPGRYEIYYYSKVDESDARSENTADKATGNFTLEGLTPNTSYYIKLRTVTLKNPNNPDNEVSSDYTPVLDAMTGYNVIFSAGANGSISSGDSSQVVKEGGACSAVTVVPEAGYHFVSWSEGQGTANPLIISDVTKNMNIIAVFEKDPDPVEEPAESGGDGGGGCFIRTL